MSSVRTTAKARAGPWTEGRVPGHEVVALTFAMLLTVAVGSQLLSGRLGLLFDLAFVSLCTVAAAAARHRDFFTVGVFPPLAMLVVMVLFAAAQRAAIAQPHDGFVQATISGLSTHGVALGLGYALCLGLLWLRRQAG